MRIQILSLILAAFLALTLPRSADSFSVLPRCSETLLNAQLFTTSNSCHVAKESQPKYTMLRPETHLHQSKHQFGHPNREEENSLSRPNSSRTRMRRRGVVKFLRRSLRPVLCSLFLWSATRSAAEAKFSYELQEAPTYSLRPGMTKSQADEVVAGTLEDPSEILSDSSAGASSSNEATTSNQKQQKAKKQTSLYGDEDDDFEDEEFDLTADDVVASPGSLTNARRGESAKSKAVQLSKTSQFAAYQTKKTPILYAKVGVGMFIPTFGAMFAREFVRRRKEEAYVKKGLEILEAQKAEYFNVTSTSENSDLEDELKDLKNKEEDDDDDEEDDDDDDDDDEDDDDEDLTPRRPRRPDGDGGGGSGGDGTGSGGDDQDTRDLLNSIFKKS